MSERGALHSHREISLSFAKPKPSTDTNIFSPSPLGPIVIFHRSSRFNRSNIHESVARRLLHFWRSLRRKNVSKWNDGSKRVKYNMDLSSIYYKKNWNKKTFGRSFTKSIVWRIRIFDLKSHLKLFIYYAETRHWLTKWN